jgi:hypothetical protein
MRSSCAVRVFPALALCLAFAQPVTAAPRAFLYVSPEPGSDKVSCWNNVAIRQGSALDRAALAPSRLTVVGSTSGIHTGRFRLAGDDQTILFTPDEPYALGENVHVRLAAGTRTAAGTTLPELAFDFRVSRVDPRGQAHADPERLPDPPPGSAWWQRPALTTQTTAGPCDTLLPGFPAVHEINVENPNAGVSFVAPFSSFAGARADIEILDDHGHALYERTFSTNNIPADFKMQHDGRLTFSMANPTIFITMDSAYALVDTFTVGNGYFTDLHDLQLLANGHALLMAYDYEPVGMDTVVVGGNPNATVIGLIVQELDENKDVIFQWRSWDHFKIIDASVSPEINLLGSTIDYVHGNSVEMMPDGNLLISCRHMNELTKVDRQTGGIIWRMGLNAANNEFTFPNDTRGFSHQHDARILPNGHLTVFDNGNNLSPQYSRALEFALDEENLVATKVWEYRHTPDVYGGFMGNVQRHADGSTTISWGGTPGATKVTDLHADGSVASELQLGPPELSYRAFRHDWRTDRILTDQQDMDIGTPAVGTPWSKTVKVWNNWNQPISIDCLRTADTNFGATLVTGSLPVTLAPGETTLVQVQYSPVDVGPTDSRLYVVQQSSSEMVAQSVVLHGHIDSNVGVEPEGGLALSTSARPNPLHARTTIEFTLPATGHVKLDVYDIVGRKVASLLDETRAAGRHVVVWSAAGRRNGLYFYRLRAVGKTLVRKLVVEG